METKRNTLVLVVLGVLTALAPFSIDMYLPGFPSIARSLNTDVAHVGLTLTSYFIGISIGQFGYGPTLDRFGRKKPVLFGLLVYVLSAVGCAFSSSLGYLVAMRFFLALGCCVGTVASNAIVRDLFTGKDVARALSTLLTVFGVAPVFAPTIGGIVTSTLGWRYIFGVLAAIGAFVFVAMWRLVGNTRPPDRSVSLRPSKVALGYLRVFRAPQFLVFSGIATAGTGGLFSYIAGSPFVFINLFGLTATQYGWVFGTNGLLFIAGSQTNRILLRKRESARILLMMTAALAVLATLLLVGSLRGFLTPWAFLALIACWMFCYGFVGPNAGAVALLPFSRNVGSAAASYASMMMFSGALASALLAYFSNGTKIPMVAMMAVCGALSFSLAIVGNVFLRRGR